MSRLGVTKTYKLFIDGKFPRSESGRTLPVHTPDGAVHAHVSHASRKDLRDAVAAARKAQPGWRNATAYLRGQILYRMAEMLEGKRGEFEEALALTPGRARAAGGPKMKTKKARRAPAPAAEVSAAVDRLVAYAGWADKWPQVLGCSNPVAGPYYNFTVPEPTGVFAVVAPDEPGLLGLVSLLAPVICAGNAAVAVGGSTPGALIATAVLGEVVATGDIPAGVVNLLTGDRAELIPWIAGHRDIDGVHAAGVSDDQRQTLREGAAENVKRVVIRDDAGTGTKRLDWYDAAACENPWWIEPLVEMKTIWHPSAT